MSRGEGRGERGECRGESVEGRGERGECRGESVEGRGERGECRGERGEGRGERGEGRGERGEGRGERREGREQRAEWREKGVREGREGRGGKGNEGEGERGEGERLEGGEVKRNIECIHSNASTQTACMCSTCSFCDPRYLLMLALPHHIELLSSATPANISYPSMMGLTAGMLLLLSLALLLLL